MIKIYFSIILIVFASCEAYYRWRLRRWRKGEEKMIKSTTQLIYLGMAIALVGLIGVYIYTIDIHRPDLHDPIHVLLLIFCMVILICGIILLEIFLPRENLERWIYESLQTKWKFQEHVGTFFRYSEKFSLFLMFLPIIYIILIPVAFLLLLFWVICEGDIAKFSETIYNFMSIILVFIFMAQTWIFYHQYRYMKQPRLKPPLVWAFSKPKSNDNCCIFLKNGGNAPAFNMSYQISEVLIKDLWKFKKTELKEITKGFLSRLDSESEKEIFEKSKGEFVKKRLSMILSAKSLDGYSILLFFYKAGGKDEVRLAKVKYRS